MRLTISIPDDIHRQLKIKAATEVTTMRALLLKGIDDYLNSRGIVVTPEGRVETAPELIEEG